MGRGRGDSKTCYDPRPQHVFELPLQLGDMLVGVLMALKHAPEHDRSAGDERPSVDSSAPSKHCLERGPPLLRSSSSSQDTGAEGSWMLRWQHDLGSGAMTETIAAEPSLRLAQEDNCRRAMARTPLNPVAQLTTSPRTISHSPPRSRIVTSRSKTSIPSGRFHA